MIGEVDKFVISQAFARIPDCINEYKFHGAFPGIATVGNSSVPLGDYISRRLDVQHLQFSKAKYGGIEIPPDFILVEDYARLGTKLDWLRGNNFGVPFIVGVSGAISDPQLHIMHQDYRLADRLDYFVHQQKPHSKLIGEIVKIMG